jgi:hypothetical protein
MIKNDMRKLMAQHKCQLRFCFNAAHYSSEDKDVTSLKLNTEGLSHTCKTFYCTHG